VQKRFFTGVLWWASSGQGLFPARWKTDWSQPEKLPCGARFFRRRLSNGNWYHPMMVSQLILGA